jgi:transposase
VAIAPRCKKQFASEMFCVILETLWNSINRARDMDTAAPGIFTRDEMESRRLLAAQDLQMGLSQSQIARKYGVSRTTASRWNRALHVRGVESLRKRRATGRPCRLTHEQLEAAAALYRGGALQAGFDSDRWTTMRFAEAVFRTCGVRYDSDHAGRIMHRLGLRERHPRRRVLQQSPAELILIEKAS